MATMILIRPGSTDYDDQQRLIGELELPVNQQGLEEQTLIVSELRNLDLPFDRVLFSPQNPAQSMAKAVGDAFPGVRLKELEELRNVNQGLWQGLAAGDVKKKFPKLFRPGQENSTGICPPNGETLADACRRIAGVLGRAIRKNQCFVVVAPDPLATVIRCTLQQRRPAAPDCLCGESPPKAVEVFDCQGFLPEDFVDGRHAGQEKPDGVAAE